MKTVALDANILLLTIRNKRFRAFFQARYPEDEWQLMTCFAGETEALSLAFRNGWGEKKNARLTHFIQRIELIDFVSPEIKKACIEIEAYTLCQYPTLKKPKGETAHRMGKNDLWIAATTYVHADRIVTTDQDFIQLDGVFFPVDYIDISEFT